MKIVAALAVGLLACEPGPSRPSAHADSANQVDSTGGLRLKLAVGSAPNRAGELPTLEAHLENVGSGTVTFGVEAVMMGDVEVDGVWHTVTWAGSCCGAPQELPPNATSGSLPILFSRYLLRSPDGRIVDIPRGRHKIRLRTRPSEHISIDGNGRRGIVVVSNAVEIVR